MAEFAEAAIDAVKAAGDLSEITKAIEGGVKIDPAELTEINNSFKGAFEGESFKGVTIDLNTKLNDVGKVEISGNIFSEPIINDSVKVTEAMKDFGPEGKAAGDMGRLFEETTGKKLNTLTESERQVIQQRTTALQDSTVYKQAAELRETTKISEAIKQDVKPETTEALNGPLKSDTEIEEALNKDKKAGDVLKKVGDNLEKEAEDAKKKGASSFEAGKWVKITFALAGLSLGGVFLYKKIKEHQTAMNGCWLIKADGSKCKVQALVCDNDVKNAGGPPCNSDDVKFLNNCSDTNDQVCKSAAFCLNQGNVTCSTYCDTTKFKLDKGQYLKCVNVDFWGAAADIAGNIVIDIIGPIIKILKYTLIAVASLIGIYILYKIFSFLFSGEGKASVKESDKKSETPSPSFGFRKKYYTKNRCEQLLRNKIGINMREMRAGRYQSPKQAVAVSYSQVKSKYPSCKKYFTR